MQDRYAGDVGDFSKFALCRVLHRELGGPLGVIWYLYPHSEANNDGKHRDYLGRREFSGCDEELQQQLHRVAHGPERSVRQLELTGVLPQDTRYFGEPVARPREAWFERAIAQMSGSKVVVVDPDNGIAGMNHRPQTRDGGKHITHEEIRSLANRFPCIVIYHHFDRSAKHHIQVDRQIALLRSIAPDKEVCAFRYHRFSPRAYFLVYESELRRRISQVSQALTEGNWKYHFSCLGLDDQDVHPKTAEMTGIAPLLIVSDLSKSIAFYRDRLGFAVTHSSPDVNPFFAIVERGGARLFLKHVSPLVKPKPNSMSHPWAKWDAFVSCADPDGLAMEWRNGMDVSAEDTDDGLRGFAVRDPDGYTLFFGRPRTL
ncbi:MAG: hypothetical protein KF812_05640 [Fimbriimonadaceae bacterium]|nr:hypothetical protein [Fimbriimonadaceae bacterium]